MAKTNIVGKIVKMGDEFTITQGTDSMTKFDFIDVEENDGNVIRINNPNCFDNIARLLKVGNEVTIVAKKSKIMTVIGGVKTDSEEESMFTASETRREMGGAKAWMIFGLLVLLASVFSGMMGVIYFGAFIAFLSSIKFIMVNCMLSPWRSQLKSVGFVTEIPKEGKDGKRKAGAENNKTRTEF